MTFPSVCSVCIAAVLTLVASGAGASPAKLSKFPLATGGAIRGSAVVENVDGAQVAFAVSGTKLIAISASGRPVHGFPIELGSGTDAPGGPAVGDFAGAKETILVAASLGDNGNGKLFAFDVDGRPFDAPWPVPLAKGASSGATLAVLGGKPVALVGSKDGRLHAFVANGTELPGWPVALGSPISAQASVADLGAGTAIVAGTADGHLFALGANGKVLPGFPFETRFAISGQPAIGDLLGDGTAAIVFGSQDFKVYALRSNGAMVKGFPVSTGYRIYGPVALVDLAGIGELDVVSTSGDGKLYAWSAGGAPLPGFPFAASGRILGGVVAGDVDRDGRDELVFATASGDLYAVHPDGKVLDGFPIRLGSEVSGTPTLTDFNEDGHLVALLGAVDGNLSAWRFATAGTVKSGTLAWPMAGHDAARSGRYAPNEPRYLDLGIAPAEGHTGEAITAKYVYANLDHAPEKGTRVRWFKNGERVPDLDDQKTIPAGRIARGEKWRFTLQSPNDFARRGDGALARVKQSPEALIVNSPPTSPKVAIEPKEPRRGQALKVVIVEESRDPDHDPVTYAVSWQLNGAPQPELADHREVDPSLIRKDQRWTVVVTPHDPTSSGVAATAGVTILDTAPGAALVTLTPANPKVDDGVKAEISSPAPDADGDALVYRYKWAVNGKLLNFPPDRDHLEPHGYRKGDVIEVLVEAFDGQLAGPPVRASCRAVNTLPTTPVVAIAPEKPRRADDLVATLVKPSADADGDHVSYRFAWTRDGVKQPQDGAVIPASALKKGETWAVEVTPSDDEGPGAAARAATRIANTPPVAPIVELSNATPTIAEASDVRVLAPPSDADGDAIQLEYLWTIDGGRHPLPKDRNGVKGSDLRKHQRWTVGVTSFDGEERSKAAYAELTVQDSPPGVAKIALEPASPTQATGLAVKIIQPASDADGDAVSYRYRWLRDGLDADIPPTQAALQPGEVRHGDRWRVEVRAFDGELMGLPVTAGAVILDRPPPAPVVAIAPADATTETELRCEARMPVDPDGDAVTLRYVWSRNAERVTLPSNTATLPARLARKGEKWRCEVRASDGELSSPAAAAELTIRDAAPAKPGIAILPATAHRTEDLACRVMHDATDADGDTVSYAYRWLRNGQPATLTEPLVPATSLRRGEKWRCEVTASDGERTSEAAAAEVNIVNAPPGEAAVAVAPEDPKVDDTMTCRIVRESVDPDADKVSYRFSWYKDGAAQLLGETSPDVPTRLVRPGDRWRCEATPTDGQIDGPTARSAEVKVRTNAHNPTN